MSDIEPELQQNSEIPVIVNKEEFTIELQNYYSGHNTNSKKFEWTSQRIQSVIKLLDEFNTIKSQGKRATSKHYHHARKYDVMNIGDQKVLIMKRKDISDPAVQIIASEDYYQIILDAHIATGHGRRDKIVHVLKYKYVVPIFAVSIFLNLCKICLSKKNFPKKGIVANPLISDDFNRRGLIDLVDFQTSPDQEYKWLLHYQDHPTKFCFLRPLKSKEAKEVAIEILKIILQVGCPNILQSDNGREFTESVLKEIVSLWPACKTVIEGPRYPQSQGSIERANEDVKNMVQTWMIDNKSTKWSIGCYFVQFQKNSSYHSTIDRTPYKALFGEDPKLGPSSTYLSNIIISKVETEEDAEELFKENKNNKQKNSQNDQEEEEYIYDLPIVADVIYDTQGNEQEKIPLVANVLPNIGNIDIVTEEMNSFVCNNICNKELPEAHTCTKCKKTVHDICGVVSEENEGYGSELLCNLCVNERSIVKERIQSHINLKRAAENILATSSKKFKDISVGSSVIIEIPKDDREPLDIINVNTAIGLAKDSMPRNDVLLSPKAEILSNLNENTMPRRKKGGDLASSAAKRRKQKEHRRNETEEEREARLQNQRTRMRTLRQKTSAGATSSPAPDPVQMPSEPSHHEVLSATQSITIPVEDMKKESSDEDSRLSFNAAPSGVEDLQHEVPVKMEDECSDDEKDMSLKQTIRDIAMQLSALKNNDSFDAFGRYVASVMRSLPPHRAMAVQPKIVNLLVQAVNGSDDKPQ